MDVLLSHGIRCWTSAASTTVQRLEVRPGPGPGLQAADGCPRRPRRLHRARPSAKIRIDEPFGPHLPAEALLRRLARLFGTPTSASSASTPRRRQDRRPPAKVMDQMQAMVAAAAAVKVTLLHENEADIYGEQPAGVKDLFATIQSPYFKASSTRPTSCMPASAAGGRLQQGLAELTHYFHIKDARPGREDRLRPAGNRQGPDPRDPGRRQAARLRRLPDHRAAHGPRRQVRRLHWPDLFAQAVAGIKKVCVRSE